MNYDSRIVEYILDEFIERDTPILTVHDSFIVPLGLENELYRLMQEAFERACILLKQRLNIMIILLNNISIVQDI